MPNRPKAILFALFSILFGAGCAFFTYYTVRLAWVNLVVQDISRHRQSGMYIGAVVFPVAALVLGYLTWRCAKAANRR